MEEKENISEKTEDTKNRKDPQERTLEEMFDRLGEITKKLEDPQTSLEESFTLYKEGSALLKEAQGRISLVDRQVREMEEDGTTADFS